MSVVPRVAGGAAAERPGAGLVRPSRRRGAHAWLVLQFALKDFKIRYTHSALGYTWSVINPLVFFVMYYVVFSVFMHFEIPNYTGFLLLSVVLLSSLMAMQLQALAVKLGVATSLRQALWDEAQLYPTQRSTEYVLSDAQRDLLRLFGRGGGKPDGRR